MRICFAGADGVKAFTPILKDNGVTARLESFGALGPKKKKPSKGWKLHLTDSGGFVARNKGVKISAYAYGNYLRLNKCKFAFNLDTNDVEETHRNHEQIKKLAPNTYIIPIYHLSDFRSSKYRDMIEDYAKQYPYIGIGGVAAVSAENTEVTEYLNHVFYVCRDKVKLHGLGQTDIAVLRKYPFYSADSTTWLSMARYGKTSAFRGRNQDDRYMLFLKRKKHYHLTTAIEIAWWVGVEQYITKLWQSRGVTFKEDDN